MLLLVKSSFFTSSGLVKKVSNKGYNEPLLPLNENVILDCYLVTFFLLIKFGLVFSIAKTCKAKVQMCPR